MQPRTQQRMLIDQVASNKILQQMTTLKKLCNDYLYSLGGFYGYRTLLNLIHGKLETITASSDHDIDFLNKICILANEADPVGSSSEHYLTFRYLGLFNPVRIHYQKLFEFHSPHLDKLAQVSQIYDRLSRLE